jgi:ATP-dependent Clp protease ATP-binding subunit ClpC
MATYLTCNVCNGRGYHGELRCLNCHGLGTVAVLGNSLVGWREPLYPFSIEVRRAARGVNRIIDFAIIGLGAVTLAFFLYSAGDFLLKNSWDVPNLLKLHVWVFFWLSTLLFFLLSARKRREKYFWKAIPRRAWGEETQKLETVANWEQARPLFSGKVIDISQSFYADAKTAVEDAVLLASSLGNAEVTPVHLFAALLKARQASIFFGRAGVAPSSVSERAYRFLDKIPKDAAGSPAMGNAAASIILDAYNEALVDREPGAGIPELMIALAKDEMILQIVEDVGINQKTVVNVAAWLRIGRLLRERISRWSHAAAYKPTGNLDRAMTAVATPTLDRFCHDLTRSALFGKLPFSIGRDKELNAVFRVMEGGHHSALLVGEPGVGKSSVLYELAQRMVEEDVPEILRDKRLLMFSVHDLVAGADPAEASGRLMAALGDIARARNIVLAVDNIDALVGVSEGGVDLFDIFSQEAGRGYFFTIATSTPQRYAEAIERRGAASAFTKIEVLEPEEDEAIKMIMAVIGGIEYDQHIFFSYAAIEKSVELSSRYLHDQALPEKALVVLREAAQAVRKARGENKIVDGEDVAAIVSEKSHVPVTAVTEKESEKLLNLESRLHERVVGQEEAVQAVSAALRRARAEVRSQKRPIAAFLFLGPTGVGKTELAKTVAAEYFGAEDAMIRLDMSEYQERDSIARLVGVPGDKTGGLLTEAVRAKPFCLLLLDEFEKAHPDILNIFLQVMDDGRLTDNQGRTADFTNTIIVATSNAASQYIQDAVRGGKPIEEIKKDLLLRELKTVYKPELLNRFDAVIVFRPLTPDEIEEIAWLMMGTITDNLALRNITFRATDEAVKELAAVGFDPVFGARPMRRVIQEKVENALAEALLKNEISRRDTAVLEPNGVIRIEKAEKL